jgi:hypothetical protein
VLGGGQADVHIGGERRGDARAQPRAQRHRAGAARDLADQKPERVDVDTRAPRPAPTTAPAPRVRLVMRGQSSIAPSGSGAAPPAARRDA